jgi:hypothetical protein
MNKNKINIISFNIPYPANYGGVIDVFYKIKTLYDSGYEIILHCFYYGRSPQPELEKYCKQVIYYKRKSGLQYLISRLPYIVVTRNSKKLLANLKENHAPILFEGLHTCFFINHPGMEGRKKIIRMHNIEHHYYAELAKATTNIFKKIYFRIESVKLKNYEPIVSDASCVAAISKNDYNYLLNQHSNIKYIPAFHPLEQVTSKPGKGDYFLYHGNLAVEENEKAILFLVDNVFGNTKNQFVIAGKSPTNKIQQKIKQHKNIQLKANPTENEMDALIGNAHCCVLPTFQTTGLKLKLLVSLFLGRHIIVNSEMIENTGLETLCEIAETAGEFVQKIDGIKDIEFSERNIAERKTVLEKFTNKNNGKELIKILEAL